MCCFERGYLREVYAHWENAKSKNSNTFFIAESNISLAIAWEQIKNGFLDFGFLTIFQSIESYANKIFDYDTISYSYEVQGINVIETIDVDEKQWLLTYEKDKSGDYFKTGKSIQESHVKPTTLFKISCLLHLEFKKNDAYLQDFGKLNKLRNDIAHGSSKSLATKDDLINVINILKEIRKIS